MCALIRDAGLLANLTSFKPFPTVEFLLPFVILLKTIPKHSDDFLIFHKSHFSRITVKMGEAEKSLVNLRKEKGALHWSRVSKQGQ